MAAKQNIINTSFRSAMRNQVKKCNAAIAAGAENTDAVLKQTISTIDKMAQKGIIHTKTAGRKISRLQKKFNA